MSYTGGPSIMEVCDALENAASRYEVLLGQVKDPNLPAVGEWNVGVTVMHTAASGAYFLSVARGDAEPMAIDSDHSVYYAHDLRWDLPELIARFKAGEEALVEYGRGLDSDPEVEFFKGIKAPASTVLSLELSEVLVHGFDIARASGLEWIIPEDEAALALSGFFPLLTQVVNPDATADLRARYEIRIRNGSIAIFDFDNGRLTLEDPSNVPVDCRLSFEPVTFLLLTFNRIQPFRALLQGKMNAGGRRFWLAGKFPGLFKSS